jgi:hypothetical protein
MTNTVELPSLDKLQDSLAGYLMRGENPGLTSKAIAFWNTHGSQINEVISAPQDYEAWIAALQAALAGADPFPVSEYEIAINAFQTVWSRVGGFPGLPKDWIRLLMMFLDSVMPTSLPEWIELYRLLPQTEAMVESSKAVVSEMAERLKPSVEAGLVEVDIVSISNEDLPRAMALCWHWISEYTSLTALAFPMAEEVTAFTRQYGMTTVPPNSFEELSSAVLVQKHPFWAGMLRDLLPVGSPFTALLRTGGRRERKNAAFLVRIDHSGQFLGLGGVVADTSKQASDKWTLEEVLNKVCGNTRGRKTAQKILEHTLKGKTPSQIAALGSSGFGTTNIWTILKAVKEQCPGFLPD